MGYTHYWYKEPEIAPEIMGAIVADFQQLILPLHDNGIPLAGSDGEGVPEITPDAVAFNGLKHCGHPQNSEISIPWPTQDGGGLDKSTRAEAGSWFAGVMLEARCCNGSCEYESFVFERTRETPEWQTREKNFDGRAFDCCKTAFRPYDIAVTAFLLVAKHHLGNKISVSTDGTDANWFDAKMLCQTVLGYGLEYEIKGDNGDLLPVQGEAPYQRPAQPKPEPKPVHTQSHAARTIAKNSRRAAEIIRMAKRCTCYSLSNNFHGDECAPAFAFQDLHVLRGSKLRDNGNGTYTVHVHGNLWYELEAC